MSTSEPARSMGCILSRLSQVSFVSLWWMACAGQSQRLCWTRWRQ